LVCRAETARKLFFIFVLTEHINIFEYEDTSQLTASPKRLGFVECSNFSNSSFSHFNQSVGLGKQGWKSLTVAQRSKSGFEPAEKTAQHLKLVRGQRMTVRVGGSPFA
jgi:hypothetical protein